MKLLMSLFSMPSCQLIFCCRNVCIYQCILLSNMGEIDEIGTFCLSCVFHKRFAQDILTYVGRIYLGIFFIYLILLSLSLLASQSFGNVVKYKNFDLLPVIKLCTWCRPQDNCVVTWMLCRLKSPSTRPFVQQRVLMGQLESIRRNKRGQHHNVNYLNLLITTLTCLI